MSSLEKQLEINFSAANKIREEEEKNREKEEERILNERENPGDELYGRFEQFHKSK